MRLYGNPNSGRYTLQTQRVVRLPANMVTGADVEARKAEQELRVLEAETDERLRRRALEKIIDKVPAMRARKDKRRRPRRVKKQVFKTYRKLKLK